MAENGGGRVATLKGAAALLVDDAVGMAVKLRKLVGEGDYQRVENLAAGLQRTARDVKWLMARLPRETSD
jgi:hypothetical protein